MWKTRLNHAESKDLLTYDLSNIQANFGHIRAYNQSSFFNSTGLELSVFREREDCVSVPFSGNHFISQQEGAVSDPIACWKLSRDL
jgi:hypothetical protein